jgi:Methyltransferase domain
MVFKLADNRNRASLASRFRRERVRRFARLLDGITNGVRILDVGGTLHFWLRHREELPAHVSVTVLNLDSSEHPEHPWLRCVAGDARRMDMFAANEFDFCFSNSVIEHLGTFADQSLAANEIRRVARGYFVQTPNIWFPIEPHFLVPGWQFAPLAVRSYLLQRRDLGWMPRQEDPALARAQVESIRLLSEREIRSLFPDGRIHREKVGLLTKSITAWRAIE